MEAQCSLATLWKCPPGPLSLMQHSQNQLTGQLSVPSVTPPPTLSVSWPQTRSTFSGCEHRIFMDSQHRGKYQNQSALTNQRMKKMAFWRMRKGTSEARRLTKVTLMMRKNLNLLLSIAMLSWRRGPSLKPLLRSMRNWGGVALGLSSR